MLANGKTEVYIYADVGIVVKIFDRKGVNSFMQEKKAFDLCQDLQGDVIPVLYGAGLCEEDGRPFLVTSYLGLYISKLDKDLA